MKHKAKRRPRTPSQRVFLSKKIALDNAVDLLTRTHVTHTQATWTQRKAETPKRRVRVPGGGQGKRAALSHSALRYFKHYDFIVVCSEAVQMGCFNLCYYRKIRRPRSGAG